MSCGWEWMCVAMDELLLLCCSSTLGCCDGDREEVDRTSRTGEKEEGVEEGAGSEEAVVSPISSA